MDICIDMILLKHVFYAVKESLGLSYIDYLWHFLDALDALLFQIDG